MGISCEEAPSPERSRIRRDLRVELVGERGDGVVDHSRESDLLVLETSWKKMRILILRLIQLGRKRDGGGRRRKSEEGGSRHVALSSHSHPAGKN
jgi:hypothetical protein